MSAALVTRGDVDMEPIVESITPCVNDVFVYNNAKSLAGDKKVYGRYLAAALSDAGRLGNDTFLVYTQDDDAICPVAAIIEAWDGDDLLVNVPADEDWPWLAWGAVFRGQACVDAFKQYEDAYPELFVADLERWPDVIFAELTPHRRVHLGHRNLEWAYAENRMYRQADHYSSQQEVRDRCRRLVSP